MDAQVQVMGGGGGKGGFTNLMENFPTNEKISVLMKENSSNER